MNTNSFRPKAIFLHKASRKLELVGEDDQKIFLSFEYLRINSPSAEVRGHGLSEKKLESGKKNVNISEIKRIGNYAVQLVFDDHHNSGIYSWEYLKYLDSNKDTLWPEYLNKLEEEGLKRDPDVQLLQFKT